MAEGGVFAWKNQRIDMRRGPACSYESIHSPLPKPPKNMEWVLDPDTKEWRLEPIPQGDVVVDERGITVVRDGDPVDDKANSDYLEHQIEKTDTFAGICLKYKLTPTELRQANCFSGSNLLLAPNPLRIPKKHVTSAKPAVQIAPKPTPNDKIDELLQKFPDLNRSEARCYLDLNDWNIKEAISSIEGDGFGKE